MGPGVLRANAMQVAIASRYPRCSATHRLFAPAATARSASAIASRVGAKPSKLTPMRTVMLAYAPLQRKDRSPDEQSDIRALPHDPACRCAHADYELPPKSRALFDEARQLG